MVAAIEPPRSQQAGAAPMHRWERRCWSRAATRRTTSSQVAGPERGDTACIIYTSGTGGVPKGVMLSHGAILCNCAGAYDLLERLGLGGEVFLSFLPLSHAYEHTAGQFFPITIGAQIYYSEGVDQLLRNLAEARPTIMTAVPRLYETMHLRIRRGIAQGGWKATLFEKAVELGQALRSTREPDLLGADPGPAVDYLVRNKIRKRFGGRSRPRLRRRGAQLRHRPLLHRARPAAVQGYGQTETARWSRQPAAR
jgi:long-chain acyl-CoA synthetase